MAIDKSLLDEIFADDDMGLIDSVVIGNVKKTEEVNITDTKEKEVMDWIKKFGREPSRDSNDVNEKMLAFRYDNIKKRENNKVEEEKKDEDPLSSPELDAMLAELDDMGLTDFSNSILTPPSKKKLRERKERDTTDYSSKRTAMADFSVFEPIFNKAQSELDRKERTTVPFSATGFAEGRFYICGGLLCFIDKIYEPQMNKFGRMDSRIHIVFANHTESYMLFATFQKIMSEENGRTLTEPDTTPLGDKLDDLREKDVETGYIYILRSLSDEKEIKPYGLDFYKVGYTGDTVEKRISNAVNEPTYLCAPVKIIEKWRCTNLNAKALETFLHRFLKDAQVKIMVNDKGRHQTASEWYNIPLGVLEVMVPMILDGSIRNYRYDSGIRKLVRIN